MDKITEALTKLLPEDQVKEVSDAVAEMLEEGKSSLEKEYNDKLEEAYGQLSQELKEAENTAYQGYEESYGIINDLRNRLEMQREEYEQQLEEGYEEAYQYLLAEREKNNNLEVGMYEEYDGKLAEMKEYIVDKVDQFLHNKGQDIYEQARRDIINDPRMAEHKVVLDKIVDLTAGYLSDEEAALATSTKLDEAQVKIEELLGQKRVLEAKIVRMDKDKKDLTEAVNYAKNVITEHEEKTVLKEQKERAEKAKTVEGKGRNTTEEYEIVKEEYTPEEKAAEQETEIMEGLGVDFDQLHKLSGLNS